MLQKNVDLSDCQIDPAPFQLVESTSLFKVGAVLVSSWSGLAISPSIPSSVRWLYF